MTTEAYVRRRRKRMSEMNVVPYIDVMLVLLIIFMVTAPLMHLGVEIDLPVGDAGPLSDGGDQVLITVTRNGELFLDTGDTPRLIDPQTLVETISILAERNPRLQVTVGGDRQASYQDIYAAMVLLQQAGVASVGLIGDVEAP
jgi:biopolymer transport protein TolR